MSKRIKPFLIKKDISVRQSMKRMKEVGEKVLFIIDDNNRLYGSLSDGDIRKWILGGGQLTTEIFRLCNTKPKFVDMNYDIEKVKQLMLKLKIETIPVIDKNKEIKDILSWNDIFSEKIKLPKTKIKVQVVIMAGGKGSRLDPFTRILPKPLIPIGEKPVVEVIMDKFAEYGIKDFCLSINHKSKMIKSYFEEMGRKYNINYIEEERPLGTIGSLSLLRHIKDRPLFVTNCDVIIDTDYAEMVNFHKKNDYDITIIVSCKNYIIPYGICEIENGGILKDIREKPEYDFLVNTGMYLMKRKVIGLIPRNRFYNINNLIITGKEKGYKIGVFPINESSWLDIGQWKEYHKTLKKIHLE